VPLLIVLTLIARVSDAGAACTFMNFDTDDLSGSGWSDPSIISTSDGDMHGQFGSSIIDRTYTGLPAHDKIKVNARLWAVGSWDSGETAFVLVDAILVFIKDRSFPMNCSGWSDFGSGFSPPPPGPFPNTACYLDISFTSFRTASVLNLAFGHSLDESISNEWFGFNRLTVELCEPSVCGNGIVDAGEECDDGNNDDGDGCSANCLIEGGCSATPVMGCLSPGGSGRSQLQIKDQDTNGPGPKDKIQWKWLKGPGLTQTAFGDPTDQNDTDFKLCIYTGATPSVIAEMQVPSGGTCGTKACWKAIPSKGYKYGDRAQTSDGVKKLILKGDVAGKSKILIQGKDGNLPLPTLPLDPNGPVIVQLSSSDPNLPCYEETFLQSNVTKNEAKQFKAKTP